MLTENRYGGWLQVASGRQVWPLDPRPEEVFIEDIAAALSKICRFGGHSKIFYSVSQHSVLVSQHVSPKNALWGLLHDASEAYLCDLPRPLKNSGSFGMLYKKHEIQMQLAIAKRFGLPPIEPEEVKRIDTVLLYTERRDLMGPQVKPWAEKVEPLPEKIEPWSPWEAERKFLERFKELGGKYAVY